MDVCWNPSECCRCAGIRKGSQRVLFYWPIWSMKAKRKILKKQSTRNALQIIEKHNCSEKASNDLFNFNDSRKTRRNSADLWSTWWGFLALQDYKQHKCWYQSSAPLPSLSWEEYVRKSSRTAVIPEHLTGSWVLHFYSTKNTGDVSKWENIQKIC